MDQKDGNTMKSVLFIFCGGLMIATVFPAGCDNAPPPTREESAMNKTDAKIVKSDAEWKKILTPEQYRVTRQCGTEAPFSGKYWNTKEKGTYACVACGAELYSSDAKYDSGSGWPSFWAPIVEGKIEIRVDTSHGMVRRELRCVRCGAHLGHVFDDGPQPTGQRHCINSTSLRFVPAEPEEK